jgi:hypothetical protein
MYKIYYRPKQFSLLISFLFSFLMTVLCHAADGGGYVEDPALLSAKGSHSYILIQFVNSNDSGQINALGNWLKEVELPDVFKHTAVNQATIYKTSPSSEENTDGRQQPNFYVVYRFYAVENYAQTSDEIKKRLDKVLKKAPPYLDNERVLFYKEHHRITRFAPRNTDLHDLPLPDGTTYPIVHTYQNFFNGDQSQTKYADYGFSQASRDGANCTPTVPGEVSPEEQWTYITWYQSVRQYDVVGKYGLYDSARMWLLVPGQDYPNYVLTMYEYTPAANVNLVELTKIWIDYYTYINFKDAQLVDPTKVSPSITKATGAGGFNYYCTGPRGNLKLIAELFKDI